MSTYTSSLGLELITPGSQAGLWGNTTNNSLTLIDQAVTGVTPISFASASGSSYTLTDFNGAENEARAAVLNITGSAIGANTVVIPNKQKTYLVRNSTGQNVTFQTPVPGATYAVEAGYSILIFCDGNNNVYTGIAAPSVGTLSVSGGGTGSTTFGSGGFIKSSGTTNALTASPTVSLSSEVTGTLPVTNGGTGLSSPTSGAVLLGNGTGNLVALSGGSAGQVLTWSGTAWTPAAPATGVSTVSGNGINVSPTSGNVVITLTSSNVTGALGYTPLNAATGVAYDSSRLGGTLASSYLTSSSGTAYDSARLGGTLASSYLTSSTGVTLSGTQTIGGSKTFSTGITVSGNVLASAFNFAAASSWYLSSSGIVGAFSGSTVIQCLNNGTYNPNGVYGTISDVNQKENIEPSRNYLDDINNVNVVKYSLKEENSAVPTKLGVIAQEVEQIFPGLIYTNEENVKSVKMSIFVPMLIKSVQELTDKLDAAEARIAALEAK